MMDFWDQIAEGYNALHDEWSGLLALVRRHEFDVFYEHRNSEKNVLEVGLGNGVFTRFLSEHFQEVFAVDASTKAIELVQEELKDRENIRFVQAFVEDLQLEKPVDNVVLSHVLEHLDDPIRALKKLKGVIHEKTTVYLSVPNANSLHRQVAVKMGLLDKVNALNVTDKKLGHKRVYSPTLFREHVQKAGFKIERFGGSLLKPLTNKQIQDTWDERMVKGFISLGNDYPELCGDIYIIARMEVPRGI